MCLGRCGEQLADRGVEVGRQGVDGPPGDVQRLLGDDRLAAGGGHRHPTHVEVLGAAGEARAERVPVELRRPAASVPLLGHGTGKLLQETAPGEYNFDVSNPPISPVTGKPISSWYKPSPPR